MFLHFQRLYTSLTSLRMPLLGAALLAVAAGSMGCGTIFSGSRDVVKITSIPDGAAFRILDRDGETVHSGRTPEMVTLNRGQGYWRPARYTVVATAAGYSERSVPLNAGLNPWYLGNIIFGGLVGLVVVDPLTGGAWDLPDELKIDFAAPVEKSEAPLPTRTIPSTQLPTPQNTLVSVRRSQMLSAINSKGS